MTAISGCLLLAAALVAARALTPGTLIDRSTRRLATATLFAAIFSAAFLVQGFGELITGVPAIGIGPASIAVSLLALVTILWRRLHPTHVALHPSRPGPFRKIPKALAWVAGATGLVIVVLLAAGLPRGFEVRAYHLPIAVRIFRDGTLSLWDHTFMHAYPAVMSEWAGFLLTMLPERLVSLANIPIFALLLGAIYALSRCAGADRSASLVVVLGLATIPIFGFSALEDGADIGGVAFVAVAAYLIGTRSALSLSGAALAGVAAGLAFGFKSLNVIPISLFGFFLISQCVAQWRQQRSVISFVPVVVYSACGVGMMSFWLIRNYVEAGNPLYPVHIKGIFDWLGWKAAPDFQLASGPANEREWVAKSRDWLIYPWVEHQMIDQNFKHSSGLGPFFAMTVPAAAVLWPLRAVSARRAFDEPLRIQAMLYTTAVVVLGTWWMLGDRQPRYAMVAIALMMPLVAVGIGAARGRLRGAYEALVALGIATMLVVLLVRIGLDNGALLLHQRGASRWQILQYPRAIDTLPANAVIASPNDRVASYALLGEGLHNHVVDASHLATMFEQPDHSLRLTAPGVRAIGLTHLYAGEDVTIATDGCVRLRELARFDRNPLNGQPVVPRSLYAVELTCADSAARADPARRGE